jgi:HK97 family phage major capsid protein
MDLKKAKEKAAAAVTAARTFAKEMKDDPSKVGEINEKFEKAMADFRTAQDDVQRMESMNLAEEEYQRYQKPAADATIRRMGMDPKSEEFKGLHTEAFDAYMKRGESGATEVLRKANAPAETYALLGTQDDLGGFLVPEDFRAEVVKDLAGYAVMRAAGARVVPTSRSQLVFPSIKRNSGTYSDIYSSNVAGAWRVEGAQGTDGSAPSTQNQPTFGQERIPVHIWQPDAIILTQEFLEDAAVPVDSIVSELLAETKALDEDSAFILGDGVVKPQGLANAGVTTVNSGAAAALTYGGLVDLFTGLPAQYRQNAKWLMNSSTFGDILKLESSGGFQLFPANSLPGTLWGKAIMFSEFVPDVAAAAVPVYFGDFRHYVIAERTDFRIQRLVERFAPNVGLMARARVGGQLVRLAAFRSQTIGA